MTDTNINETLFSFYVSKRTDVVTSEKDVTI